MRVQLFRFDRYQAGQTDFETGGAAQPGNPIEELDDALKIIASGIAGIENVRSTITVAGHSDRQATDASKTQNSVPRNFWNRVVGVHEFDRSLTE